MNSTHIAYVLWGLLFFTIPLSHTARAQFRETISLDIIQRAQPGGGTSYGIRAVTGPFTTALIAPDGTQFGPPPGIRPGLDDLAFSELSSRFFGTWTIRERSFVPPFAVSEHSFTLSPFVPNNLFSDTPIITTPADLSIVPTGFTLEWTYAGGAMPSSRLVSHSIMSGDAGVDIRGQNQARFNVVLEGEGPATLTVRAGTTVDLFPYISPVLLVSGPSQTDYRVSSRFQILSEPVRLTVVPEPHILLLVAMGTGTLIGTARRPAPIRLQ
jgi:hypothetical protein